MEETEKDNIHEGHEGMENEEEGPSGSSMEELLRSEGAAAQDEASFRDRLKRGEVVWVKVVQILPDAVQVDVGEKLEGVVPLAEFLPQEAGAEGPSRPPAAGSRIPVILSSPARGDRPAVLSHKRARVQIAWNQAQKAFAEKARVRGMVTASIKGGFTVDVGGIQAFLPASLADLRPVRKPRAFIGTGVRCLVVEVHPGKRQLVLSRKAVLEEEVKKRRGKALSKIKPGDVMIARILHSSPTGLVVSLGTVEGFVPTQEIAWREPEKARAGAKPGEKLRLKVQRLDVEAGKVLLSAKLLLPNPADSLKKKFPVKGVLKLKVTAIKPEGVQLAASDGTPAFCPVSELPGAEPPERPGRDRDRDRDFGRPAERGPKPPPAKIEWPAAGASVTGIITGVHLGTFEVLVSLRRYEDMQDKKRVAQYLRKSPPLTLGQILSPDEES